MNIEEAQEFFCEASESLTFSHKKGLKTYRGPKHNTNKFIEEIYHSRNFQHNTIAESLKDLYADLPNFTFDNLVNNCYLLFTESLNSFEVGKKLKCSIEYLVAEYIKIEDKEIINHTSTSELAEKIFDDQILHFIAALEVSNEIILTNQEKSYLEKKGANLDFSEVLNKSLKYFDAGKYTEAISLSDKVDYSLPAIKCLILFEDEGNFIERLKTNSTLKTFSREYKDYLERTILHYAAVTGKAKIVQELCIINKESIDSTDGYQRTPLHLASSQGYLEVIKILLKYGTDLNAKDGYARTPLHIAAINDQPEAITLLVNAGSKLNAEDGKGKIPLRLAIQKDSQCAVEKFLELGIDFNKSIDEKGNTPIHLAAKYNSVKTLKFLIAYQIQNNLESKNNGYGGTPLHEAAYAGSIEAFDLLLKNGANIIAMDNYDRLPLESAMTRNDDLIEFIGAEEATVKKIHIAAKCIDYDYTVFIIETWRHTKLFSNTAINAFGNKDEVDKKVHQFVIKVGKFLKSNTNELLKLLDTPQDHIPLIIKIAELQKSTLLKQFITELPEFIHTLSNEQKSQLFIKIDSNNELLELLEPICHYQEQIKKLFQENNQYHSTELCDLLEIHEFGKLKNLLGLSINNDESFLNNIAVLMCNNEYKAKYYITTEVAQIVFGEVRDQLESLGADITDIINAYNM